ncbi:MAG: hypothetical protein IKR67_01310 [Lachnospiraceae bacterium]|nr:hypothetical protein [Lachnospiraceae bacterium]
MLLNNELEITFPDGFIEMGPDSMAGLSFVEKGRGVCMKDEGRHIIITVGWKHIGKLAGLLLNENDLEINMETRIRNAHTFLSYEDLGPKDIILGGEKCEGFVYGYVAKCEVKMQGESYVLRHGDILYYLHYYTRREFAFENSSVFYSIIDSAEWK